MVDHSQVEKLVREKLQAKLGQKQQTATQLDFINADYIHSLASDVRVVSIPLNAVITPLARELAEKAGIEFRFATATTEILAPDNPNAIAIGCDHGGFAMKQEIKKALESKGYQFVDVGTHSEESVDYPDFAHAVASLISCGKCHRGVIIDGAGIGSAIVANKVPRVRAAHCHNLFEVKNSREHNNANVLSLGGRVIGVGLAIEMVEVWLQTDFAGGRHQRRVDKMIAVEQQYLARS